MRMYPETESGDRPNLARFPEDHARFAIDLGRMIMATLASGTARYRRASYVSDSPSIIPPLSEVCARKPNSSAVGISRSPHGRPTQFAAGQARDILGPTPPDAPRICAGIISGERPDMSKYPEDPAPCAIGSRSVPHDSGPICPSVGWLVCAGPRAFPT